MSDTPYNVEYKGRSWKFRSREQAESMAKGLSTPCYTCCVIRIVSGMEVLISSWKHGERERLNVVC